MSRALDEPPQTTPPIARAPHNHQPMAATPASSERTLIEVLRLSTDYLAQHGSTSPRLDAELLLAHALGVRRIDLYLLHDRPLREPELGATRELVRRRGGGEPVAYITGVREFYNRAFAVTPAVLIPRPETETLVDVALRRLRELSDGGEPSVADLGTGSGCIAVTLAAEIATLHVVATDMSSAALDVARGNATTHEVEQRVTFIEGDWAGPLTTSVDVVVSNPPYVTSEELTATARDVRDFEPRLALDGGSDGLDAYRALVASLHRATHSATVLLEIDPRRAGLVADIVRNQFAGAQISFHKDLTRRDRVLEARLQ